MIDETPHTWNKHGDEDESSLENLPRQQHRFYSLLPRVFHLNEIELFRLKSTISLAFTHSQYDTQVYKKMYT